MINNSHTIKEKLITLGEPQDWIDKLAASLSQKKVIFIGESTHGTHEFYKYRALLTQKLIEKYGFNFVAIEADWPDAYQVNSYVKGFHEVKDELDPLSGFKRFPSWMWRNSEVLEFVTWLKTYNNSLPTQEKKVGFYGLDIYSLFSSIDAVIQYLLAIDPEAAERAIAHYSCFDHYDREAQNYALAVNFGIKEDCQQEAVSELMQLEQKVHKTLQDIATDNKEDAFSALQNARTVKSAEAYYRAMFDPSATSWNLRDQHMFDTLTSLIDYYDKTLSNSTKAIVWAHNSHIGNAAATEMIHRGELNIGQLAKEKYKDDAFLLGLTTSTGTVIAAEEWGGSAELRQVNEALPGSWEELLQNFSSKNFFVPFYKLEIQNFFSSLSPKLQRAIGVIYRPETERQSHYFYSHLAQQYDGLIYLHHTSALSPLDVESVPDQEPPETFPSAL